MAFNAKFPFDDQPNPPPSEQHGLTDFNPPKFGKPIPQKLNILDEIADLTGLGDIVAPDMARKLLKIIGAAAGILLLATIAFTPQGMAQFFHHLGHTLALLLSPVGIRLVAFTLLIFLAIAGIMYCLAFHNDLVAVALMIAGIFLGCFTVYGCWQHFFPIGDWGLVLGVSALGLTFFGWELHRWNWGKVYEIQPEPPRQPVPSPFPDARAATAHDMHSALNKPKPTVQSEPPKYKRRD